MYKKIVSKLVFFLKNFLNNYQNSDNELIENLPLNEYNEGQRLLPDNLKIFIRELTKNEIEVLKLLEQLKTDVSPTKFIFDLGIDLIEATKIVEKLIKLDIFSGNADKKSYNKGVPVCILINKGKNFDSIINAI